MEEEDNVQNMDDDDDDDERGLEWEHEVRDVDWLDDDDDDDEEEMILSRKRPAERSGHVAVTDGTCMFVWGGYKNAEAADLYLPKNEIWIYNMETARWKMKRSKGDVPDSMSGSCGTCVDGFLYLFGGHHARGNTNLVYRLPLRSLTFRWEKMNDIKGLAPTSKDKLGCWVYKNKLVYFGGYGYAAPPGHRGTFELDEMGNHVGRGWNNHIHILDLETLTWSQPITKGNAPSPRAAHACATLDNRGYVFGGRYLDHRLNDLYYINLDTWTWSEICFPQRGPTGRSWHSLTSVSPDHLFLFGGFTTNRETLSDAWIYCVSKNEWKPFNPEHAGRPRLWHTACLGHDGEVFVFGGCANNLLSNELAAHSNDLLVFSVLPKSLLRLCLDAAVQYRKPTEHLWDVLPKHLLLQLKQRIIGDA
ncbi:kelch domain-containing protein 2 [Triplophysa rosa]|uniref:Kelch domain-containing protein 2-like n=1 Tax=Triplophysa rosa TaxID=992332 RepID=A0A9W7TS67_TRIRA|nr:kelch domain-containing protein 2 [Triplophysa rosa]XP_057199392.1 kelch domain-containing protein 2 [Triplophysa rosa]XP_057199394.1 kelch domain-containing protein 2 [Triplophysa rosa]XP_057199395.1 kelch domain-containing protein 2 [Triplophysa rosa]XP_057199396.1 kelch domain-containing protein 2 [Triplophysa rosa]KAI7804373.1 putative kelch domain-containing protein 2-like [Triplophysa rosa]